MQFDTDVLIWLLRGNTNAAEKIMFEKDRCISVITFMELLKNAANKNESAAIKKMIKKLNFTVIPINDDISHRSLIYMEEHGLKSGISVADCLIAATAAESAQVLCTANHKDFRAIVDIELEGFKA